MMINIHFLTFLELINSRLVFYTVTFLDEPLIYETMYSFQLPQSSSFTMLKFPGKIGLTQKEEIYFFSFCFVQLFAALDSKLLNTRFYYQVPPWNHLKSKGLNFQPVLHCIIQPFLKQRVFDNILLYLVSWAALWAEDS